MGANAADKQGKARLLTQGACAAARPGARLAAVRAVGPRLLSFPAPRYGRARLFRRKVFAVERGAPALLEQSSLGLVTQLFSRDRWGSHEMTSETITRFVYSQASPMRLPRSPQQEGCCSWQHQL